MKSTQTITLFALLTLFVQFLNGQNIAVNRFPDRIRAHWQHAADSIRRLPAEAAAPAPPGKGQTIFLLTPSVPFSFGQVQKDNAGNWQVSAAATIGGSYALVIGNGYRDASNPNNPIQVEPYIILGVYVNAGLAQNNETTGTGGAVGNLQLGGILGIYKYINLLAAYDVLNNKAIFGIGARIDIFSFAQGAGSVILNKDFTGN